MSIVVDHLTKKYEEQLAIDAISFTIKKGEIVGFLGPNGAGKSTTMKILAGFITPSSGNAIINEKNVLTHSNDVKKSIGYLPENNPLYEDMYVKEFLEFIAKIYKVKDYKSAVDQAILKVKLNKESHKKIGQLSKGYQQRVGIAQAIIHDPSVLILDEPTSGLDPNQLDDIRNLIIELGKTKTILLSTHIMQEVESICDRIIVIKNGKLVADDAIQNKKSKNKEQVIEVEFDKKVSLKQLEDLPGIVEVKSKGKNWIISSNNEEDLRIVVSKFASKNNLLVLTIQKHSDDIEGIFKKLTK
ncbi:MAG: gliding motility-associated ABC transporter ATP-binding subunit GldA [Crocinitomicaceae bacterium]|nr:gliding motility-associated ABC transporter ATP-binding subunit GldA [Crocinitomicaceae bacterium]